MSLGLLKKVDSIGSFLLIIIIVYIGEAIRSVIVRITYSTPGLSRFSESNCWYSLREVYYYHETAMLIYQNANCNFRSLDNRPTLKGGVMTAVNGQNSEINVQWLLFSLDFTPNTWYDEMKIDLSTLHNHLK